MAPPRAVGSSAVIPAAPRGRQCGGGRSVGAGPSLGARQPSRPPRRLLLTSSGLARAAFRQGFLSLLAARKPGGGAKVVYIPDAAVGNGCEAATAHAAVAQQLHALGVSDVQCVELRTTAPEVLARELEGVDCLYVEMGNTYYLRYYMHTSGFDRLARPLVREAGVVYVGSSAGSIAAGRSISVAFWKGWDDPGYGQEWDLQQLGYDGLDLLPGGRSVFPHYAPRWRSLAEARRDDLDHEVVLLDEEHAYIVDGEREELIPPPAPPSRASRSLSGSWSSAATPATPPPQAVQ